LESFEILDSSHSSNCSCSYLPSDKSGALPTEAQTPLFPESSISSWLSDGRLPPSKCEKSDRVFPTFVAIPSFWLCAARVGNERLLKAPSDDDLATKMATMVLKHEKEKRAEVSDFSGLLPLDAFFLVLLRFLFRNKSDIGVDSVCCKPVNGEPFYKRLDGCAIQAASEAILKSTKQCIGTWIACHTPKDEKKCNAEANLPDAHASESSVLVTQLRKIGATDYGMWLSTKRRNETGS
uniref:Pecanex-like protein n=1 Tax=Hydatigena taeniaeformis TaxID=6205 RepID=A0A0R3WRS1_HYDTA